MGRLSSALEGVWQVKLGCGNAAADERRLPSRCGSTALVVPVLPLIAFGTRDGRFAVDLGAGVAVLSQTKFAEQDFGGPVQGALTFGMGIPVYKRFGVGYRFMHYSDWGAYGDTIGADLHMVELIYRF
jgi:hypothetical protein